MMGFDVNFFNRILLKFGPMYSGHTPLDEAGRIVVFEYTRGQRENSSMSTALG
jgi:hypothetical protein